MSMNKSSICVLLAKGLSVANTICATFLVIATVALLLDVCNRDERESGLNIPALSELTQKRGIYVLDTRMHKGGPRGAILVSPEYTPATCGYFRESLRGMQAIGWFDSKNRIYQLQVGDQFVCDYNMIVQNIKDRTIYRLVNIVVVAILCVLQFILFITLRIVRSRIDAFAY